MKRNKMMISMKIKLMMLRSAVAGILCGICAVAYSQTCSPTPMQQSYKLKAYQNVMMTVNGKTYNVGKSDLWFEYLGGVVSKQDGIVIVDCLMTHNLTAAVTNYAGDAVATKPIFIAAMRIGTYDYAGTPLELWDCGKPYVPAPPTPEQVKAAQEAGKIRAIADKKRALEGQTNAFRWLLSQATNGSASTQCSLGLHYLNGQGCETNREQAFFWLQKATDQGDMEASNKLAQLKSP